MAKRRVGHWRKPPKGAPRGKARNPAIPAQLTAEREARAWDLYTRHGQTQREIATVLGVTQQAVCKALRRVEDRTLAELKDQSIREKARQVARIEGLYREAMASWRKSAVVMERVNGGRFLRRRLTPGDPRFLQAALHALADIRKVLGIDAPTRFEGTLQPKTRPLETMTPEELQAEIAAAQNLLGDLGVTIH